MRLQGLKGNKKGLSKGHIGILQLIYSVGILSQHISIMENEREKTMEMETGFDAENPA